MDGTITRRLITGVLGLWAGLPKLANFVLWLVGLAGLPADYQTWLRWLGTAPWPRTPEVWTWIILGLSVALFIWPSLPERGFRWIKSLAASAAFDVADITLTDAHHSFKQGEDHIDTGRLRECAGRGEITVWGRPQQEAGGLEVKNPTFGLEIKIPPEYWVRNDISWITLFGTERTSANDGGETYGKLRLNKSQLQKANLLS